MRKKGIKKLSTCNKLILLILKKFGLFLFIMGNIIYFTFTVNKQIHLSYADTNTSDIKISWITFTNSPLDSNLY